MNPNATASMTAAIRAIVEASASPGTEIVATEPLRRAASPPATRVGRPVGAAFLVALTCRSLVGAGPSGGWSAAVGRCCSLRLGPV
jgi:hypothetical protein